MKQEIREPFVAGQFYEKSPELLTAMLNKLEHEEAVATTASQRHVRAVILPHAGYVFSARTAAKTLLRASGGKYSKAVILAPSHRYPFKGIAASGFSSYRTPLGDVQVNTEAVKNILDQEGPLVHNIREAHQYEHSLEVELPLLQHFFGQLEIIPLIAGFIDNDCANAVAKILRNWWQPDVLWVISSDFTHYGRSFSYMPFERDVKNKLRELDLGAIKFILDRDFDGFNRYISQTGATICGAGPIKILLAMLATSAAEGENISTELVDYTTSGELTGDFSHCVSYAGIAFYDGE
ncbi:MAG: AmmeMemoRadiSam system protein B [Victivallaceae bacterium]